MLKGEQVAQHPHTGCEVPWPLRASNINDTQTVITLMLPGHWYSLWCLQSHLYDKEKQQQVHCSWVYFVLKSNYLKLHLRIEESATPFDDVIPSLMMLLLDPFAYAAMCCPCHYSTSTIPVPFADGEAGACRVLEAAMGLLASCQPLLTISSSSVLKPRSQLCGICAA